MSNIHIPEFSKENTQTALQGLAHCKFLKDKIADAEKAYKAYLTEYSLEPGSKATAYVDGLEIATVSRSKIKASTPVLAVVDTRRFINWLKTHEPVWYDANIQQALPEWVTEKDLERFVEDNNGELPDGLGVVETKPSGGALSVRMTPAQEDNYCSRFIPMVEASHLLTAGGGEE